VHDKELHYAIMDERARQHCQLYLQGGDHTCNFGAKCRSRHDPVELAKVMAMKVMAAKAAEEAKLAAAVAAAALPVASSAFTAAPLVHAAPLVMAS
jgi:hypothetical protein